MMIMDDDDSNDDDGVKVTLRSRGGVFGKEETLAAAAIDLRTGTEFTLRDVSDNVRGTAVVD